MKNKIVQLKWLALPFVASSSFFSLEALGYDEVVRKIGYLYQNVIDDLKLECEGIHNYLVGVPSLNLCFPPHPQDEMQQQTCAIHRKTLNILNWGHASPNAEELQEGSGIAWGLDKLWKDFGLEQNPPELVARATNESADSARFDALRPDDGVPENFLVQTKSTFWIRSAIHACDWLKGDLKISFDAQIEAAPEALTDKVLGDAWVVYQNARQVNSSLSDPRLKALLQAYILLNGLPKEFETGLGSKEKLIKFFFAEQDESIALIELEGSETLEKKFIEAVPKNLSLKTIVLEPRQ